MSSPERGLRILQIAQIAFIVACFFVKRLGNVETSGAISLVQWFIVAGAVWSAISGFSVQRRFNRSDRPQNRTKKSTALSRWRAGHTMRLASATAVGLWGMVLHYSGGPDWLVNSLLGLALLLLLIWKPGAVPAENTAR